MHKWEQTGEAGVYAAARTCGEAKWKVALQIHVPQLL
jgi:hypothetical protein